MRGLSLVAASGAHSSSRCAGLSPARPLLLRSASSRRAGSVVVAHGPSYSAAYGIFPDQGSNLCPLHWQVDSQPLRHQGSPTHTFNGMLANHPGSPYGTVVAASERFAKILWVPSLASKVRSVAGLPLEKRCLCWNP